MPNISATLATNWARTKVSVSALKLHVPHRLFWYYSTTIPFFSQVILLRFNFECKFSAKIRISTKPQPLFYEPVARHIACHQPSLGYQSGTDNMHIQEIA